MQRMALWRTARRVLMLGLGLGALSGCAQNTTTAPGDASGVRLAIFASDRNQTVGQYDLYLYDIEAGGFHSLGTLNSITSADLHPTMTPEGRFVAFDAVRAGAGGSDILLFDRARFVFGTLPAVNTAADETEPFFTHSGTRLAFTQTAGAFRQVRLLDGLGDTLIALPGLNTPTSNNQSPSPNNDGSKIAFVSDRNGNPDVFVYDASGDSLMSFPDLVSDSTDTDPWLTPDGHFLAFASSRMGGAGGLDIYLYDLTTKSFVTLAATLNTTKTERNPALSPDGTIMVLESNRTGSVNDSMDIWSYNRTTGLIVESPGENSSASDLQPFLLWH